MSGPWGLPLLELARQWLQDTLPAAVIYPSYTPLFLLVIGLVALQYARIARMEAGLYGQPLVPTWHRVLTALAAGLVGGFVGAMVMMAAGVVLEPRDVLPLWPVALALAFIRPRFMCFAYATGVIGVSALLVGWPDVHVPGLVALVGALHVAEAILVYIDGAEGATPVLARNGRGEVVGGYLMQRFWPVPAAILVLLNMPAPGQGIAMPDWWPLVRPGPLQSADPAAVVVAALPLLAALGYTDVALTAPPGARSRRMALGLVGYGAALMAMAVLAERRAFWVWPAVLASPLLHEAMIFAGLARERWGRPAFGPAPDGLRVLWVGPRSQAARLGLEPGDVILRVNGQPVRRPADLREAGGPYAHYLRLEVRRGSRSLTVETNRFDPKAPLGLLLVPPPDEPAEPVIDLGAKRLFGA